MKFITGTLFVLAVTAFLSVPGAAQEGGRRAEMIKKYDKNGDGKLDEAEREAMRKDRRAARGEEPQDEKKEPRPAPAPGERRGPMDEKAL
ncbi:MAG: hypothetical protein H6807_17865, partial [Planctomycetes bacterium]|nr:hypothetical protein [Planctomycetota bacterium]